MLSAPISRSSRPRWRLDRFTVLLALFTLLCIYTFCPDALLAIANAAGWSPRNSNEPLDLLRQRVRASPSSFFKETERLDDDVAATADTATQEGLVHREPVAPFTLDVLPMIPSNPHFPLDSTAETLMLKPSRGHSYHICTFTNVCVAPDGILFRFQNHTQWSEMNAMAKKCESMEFYWSNRICHCFHYAFKPLVMPYEFATAVTKPLAEARSDDVKRKDGKSSFIRRYPDPFAYVAESHHQHFWSIHKWVSHHHIAHWAQKLMIFQSIYQHHRIFQDRLPPLTGMVFHDTSNTNPPLEDHLLNIFNISMDSAIGYHHSGEWAHPEMWSGADAAKQFERLMDPSNGRLIWNEDIISSRYTTSKPPGACVDVDKCGFDNPSYKRALQSLSSEQVRRLPDGRLEPLVPVRGSDDRDLAPTIPDPNLHTCFARLSMSPTYGLLSLDPSDVDAFRAATARHMNHPRAAPDNVRSCPPRRAILLTRDDRRILNVDAIIAYMRETFQLDLELHQVTERDTSRDQIALFSSTGLILSSHSSQMINVLFSHAGQSLVEITPEFYNVDFAAYAHALGLNFNYALGGTIPESVLTDPKQSPDYTYVADPLMTSCVAALNAACPTGDSWCIVRVSPQLCGAIVQWPNKQMNFYANLTAVQIAVQQSMSHIQDRCFGKW